jgi:hypothetical protein
VRKAISVAMIALVVGVTVGVMVGTAGEARQETVPGKPAEVVAALAEKPPRVLSELEAIVGPLHRDPAKWEDAIGPLQRNSPSASVARANVELDIDIYHQRPEEEKDPSLWHWALDFKSGRDACRQLLAKRFPKPQALRDSGRQVLRFGDLYFSDLDVDGGFRLAWYEREPLFAIPERSESATAKLVAALAAIANAGFSRQAIAAHLGPLTYDSQRGEDVLRSETWSLSYEPAGAARPERFVISFKRPLPSRDLLPKLGILRPAVDSGDSHMQSRSIIDLEKRRSPETGYSLPAVKGYVVRIYVDPKGLVEIDEKAPASLVWSAEGSQISSFEAFLPRR